MEATAPKKAPPPPPPKPASRAPSAAPVETANLEISRGVTHRAQRVVIYGAGGVGKTELASNIAQLGIRPLFIDIDEGSDHLDIARVRPRTWDEIRGVLHNEAIVGEFDAIVTDTLTKAQELAEAWVIQNIAHEKGAGHVTIKSIEDYGWGKGPTHVYETFLTLLGDFDALARRGKQIICIAHDCTANVPNPAGEDWIRYEPRLQSPASGKASIRHRIKEWADHLLFVGFDTFVSNDGKGKGAGTRTIYPSELPTHWAKSRRLSSPIVYQQGSAELWNQLLGKD